MNEQTEQTPKPKTKWFNITIALGNMDVSQERRAAYDAAAFKDNMKVTEWARRILDEKSGFKA